jgi:hypothetical protein
LPPSIFCRKTPPAPLPGPVDRIGWRMGGNPGVNRFWWFGQWRPPSRWPLRPLWPAARGCLPAERSHGEWRPLKIGGHWRLAATEDWRPLKIGGQWRLHFWNLGCLWQKILLFKLLAPDQQHFSYSWQARVGHHCVTAKIFLETWAVDENIVIFETLLTRPTTFLLSWQAYVGHLGCWYRKNCDFWNVSFSIFMKGSC